MSRKKTWSNKQASKLLNGVRVGRARFITISTGHGLGGDKVRLKKFF